jgi:hypothetical protein
MSIRIGDSVQSDICSRFNRLLNSDWTDRDSSKALRDLYNAKLNKREEVPLTDHVVKLKAYLENEVEDDYNAFNKKPGRETGRKLAEDLLTQIIVFNKRRGGEASRLKVDTYLDVKKKCKDLKLNAELYCSLDADEKLMANSHLLIRTIGKCGTHVPIILTRKMKSAVDVLVAVADRKKIGFSDSNPYVFGIPGCDTHLKAWSILNAICKRVKSSRNHFYVSSEITGNDSPIPRSD